MGDVAFNGSNFCPAAYHAMLILANNATTAVVLKGASWLFELAGVGGSVAGGVGLTLWMCKTMTKFNDPTSKDYIAEPFMVCVASGLVCLVLALPFVIVFGH